MNREYYKDVVIEKNVKKYLKELDDRKLVIYSPTSINKIDIENNKCEAVNWHFITKNRANIDNYIMGVSNKIDEVITLGGGSVIDIGKYIANKLKIKLICIPTMLSTNSYATNKVALIENDKKVTLNSKMPDEIIIDNQLLKLSMQENIYGLADVLSIYTALNDWKIANEDIDEKINFEIYNEAEKLLNNVVSFINSKSLKEIGENNLSLFNFIGEAGYITNVYGTGRPESGSEHILAKEIEKRIDIPHGISVSIGIILMSLMQKQYNESIMNAIAKLKMLDNGKKYGLDMKIIIESLKKIKKREDRYTIVNRYNNMDDVDEIINEVEKIIRKNKVDLN